MEHLTLKNKILIIVAGILITIAVASSIYCFYILNRDVYYKGIVIEDIDVSNLDITSARRLINDAINNQFADKSMLLTYENDIWTIHLRDISYIFLIDEVLLKAYSYGRNGNYIERLNQINALRHQPIHFKIGTSLDRSKLIAILEGIKISVEKKGENASLEYASNDIMIHHHELGIGFNVDKNANILENKILERDFSSTELEVYTYEPDIIYDELKLIDGPLASFNTSFNANDVNRSHNIKLSCAKLNNRIIMPGEVFSMDKALGSRTAENGYKDAPVIIRNELVEGIGGGICQVTTTLYNAVLLSELEVVERKHHSWPLAYVKPGMDATISEGFIDFKFRNNHKTPVALSTSVVGNKMEITIIGKTEKSGKRMRVVSEIISVNPPTTKYVKIDNSLKDDEIITETVAKNGMKAAVYREFYRENNLIKKEQVSVDVYQPINAVIKMNNKTYEQLKETQKFEVMGE